MSEKVIIIAEAGVNHNGDFKTAKMMVDVALDAGVDIVKFQTFKTEKLVSKDASMAAYQIENLKDRNVSQFEMLKSLELDIKSHRLLMEHCEKKGIGFLSTAFDLESVDELASLNISMFKIPSGEINNLPYLRKVGAKGKGVLLSTGMARLGEIELALEALMNAGASKNDITVLHCNTEYPTPIEDVNLLAMLAIKEAFKVKIGYSDHTLGIEIPIAAVALGATVIEKHFTLDKQMLGPDHKASLDPLELKAMVNAIRNIEKALGDGVKKVSNSERKNITAARKSIHTFRKITKGQKITLEDLIMKRPGTGISPMEVDSVVGKIADKDLGIDEIIKWRDLL